MGQLQLSLNFHLSFIDIFCTQQHAVGHRLIGWSYNDYQVLDPAAEAWEDIAGLTFVEIANRWKTSPTDVWLKLSQSSGGAAQILYHGYGDEGTLDSVLSSDLCLSSNDNSTPQYAHPALAARLAASGSLSWPVLRWTKVSILWEQVRA